MSRRTFFPNLNLAVCALSTLAVFAAIAPASAGEIGNSKFTLTFPDTWSKLSIGINDSAAVTAYKIGAGGGTAIMAGSPHQGSVTPSEIATYMAIYGSGDELTKTDDGTKTLGGKQFVFLEFKENEPEEGEEDTRYRIYYYAEGNYLFQLTTFYKTTTGTAGISDIEQALGTLKLSPTVGIRAATFALRRVPGSATLDILGRFQNAGLGRTPLLLRP